MKKQEFYNYEIICLFSGKERIKKAELIQKKSPSPGPHSEIMSPEYLIIESTEKITSSTIR